MCQAMKIGGRDLWRLFNAPQIRQPAQKVTKRRQTFAGRKSIAMATSHTQATRTWCHCRRCSFDDMVMCDNTDCPTKWFHMSCVKMTMANVPDIWYCANCRELSSAN